MKTNVFEVVDPLNTVRAICANLGMKEIGAGCYGIVYGSPEFPDRVFKIGRLSANRSYLRYIMAVSKSDNPHLPKVFNLEYYYARGSNNDITQAYFLLELERLQPFQYTGANATLFENLAAVVEYGREIELPEAMAYVANLIKSVGYSFDLHTGNVMIRSCGTMVVTDPLAS